MKVKIPEVTENVVDGEVDLVANLKAFTSSLMVAEPFILTMSI